MSGVIVDRTCHAVNSRRERGGHQRIPPGAMMDSDIGRLLVPYDEAMHVLGGIGRTKFYELIEDRELEQVKIGRRGFITAKSLAAYVDRLSTQVPA
jgi:hypothetical protein